MSANDYNPARRIACSSPCAIALGTALPLTTAANIIKTALRIAPSGIKAILTLPFTMISFDGDSTKVSR
jgi:hypothetical protein